MSRKHWSWLKLWGGRSVGPGPLAQARLERRLRSDADAWRAPLPGGLGRRTLDALQADRVDRMTAPLFFRPAPTLAALSFVALLLLAVLIATNLSAPTEPPPRLQATLSLRFPSPRALQDEAAASMRRIERITGIDLDRPELSDPLTSEARALLHDASRAARAILTSMPNNSPRPRIDTEARQDG